MSGEKNPTERREKFKVELFASAPRRDEKFKVELFGGGGRPRRKNSSLNFFRARGERTRTRGPGHDDANLPYAGRFDPEFLQKAREAQDRSGASQPAARAAMQQQELKTAYTFLENGYVLYFADPLASRKDFAKARMIARPMCEKRVNWHTGVSGTLD